MCSRPMREHVLAQVGGDQECVLRDPLQKGAGDDARAGSRLEDAHPAGDGQALPKISSVRLEDSRDQALVIRPCTRPSTLQC